MMSCEDVHEVGVYGTAPKTTTLAGVEQEKPDPVTVRSNAVVAGPTAGWRPVIAGTGAAVTVRETLAEVPPPGAGLVTTNG
jgi:hypothetical protein